MRFGTSIAHLIAFDRFLWFFLSALRYLQFQRLPTRHSLGTGVSSAFSADRDGQIRERPTRSGNYGFARSIAGDRNQQSNPSVRDFE
jgi:hypothetical protein